MLLEDPFGKDVSFRIRLMGITLEYTNLELQKEIEEKYAGQDYLVDGEEAAGLFCSDILTDEEWEFDVTFDSDNQFMELITKPVFAQAKVWRYADKKTVGYRRFIGRSADFFFPGDSFRGEYFLCTKAGCNRHLSKNWGECGGCDLRRNEGWQPYKTGFDRGRRNDSSSADADCPKPVRLYSAGGWDKTVCTQYLASAERLNDTSFDEWIN